MMKGDLDLVTAHSGFSMHHVNQFLKVIEELLD